VLFGFKSIRRNNACGRRDPGEPSDNDKKKNRLPVQTRSRFSAKNSLEPRRLSRFGFSTELTGRLYIAFLSKRDAYKSAAKEQLPSPPCRMKEMSEIAPTKHRTPHVTNIDTMPYERCPKVHFKNYDFR